MQPAPDLNQIASVIDHTLLKPDATPAEIEVLCSEAVTFSFASVCVNSVYIPLASQLLKASSVKPISVVGFPLGACGSSTKAFEADRAIHEGAREIDMVIASGALKAALYTDVTHDISRVVRACGEIPVKVIIETHLLTDEQKKRACLLAVEAGAQFVKTCTGFLGGGATVADVQLMRASVGPDIGVKASGGIRDLATAQQMLQAGATRLGTSSGVAIVSGLKGSGYLTMLLPAELIKKKRSHKAHSQEEIEFLVKEYAQGRLPDYQMSAWLMAVFLNGMSAEETHFLTQAMLFSGDKVQFTGGKFYVDKHSTGGVGDKTSLILAPVVASLGIAVPMISGRGLGHTGGTLDKLESIPGFNTQLDLKTFEKFTEEYGLCFIGQTKEICPADKKMYALRDVTGTVESLPLICASILSKKLAEGIEALVLDVKYGSGAFMKSQEQAGELAQNLQKLGRAAGKKVSAFITSMNQPLGEWIGNSVEIFECLEILRHDSKTQAHYTDTRELSLELAAEMVRLKGDLDAESARKAVNEALQSGQAYEKFAQICTAQGGNIENLEWARHKSAVLAPVAGNISLLDTEKIGIAAIQLGAGRLKTSDLIDPLAGIRIHKKLGEPVEKGEILYEMYASDSAKFTEAQATLLQATTISLQKQVTPSLIIARLLDQP